MTLSYKEIIKKTKTKQNKKNKNKQKQKKQTNKKTQKQKTKTKQTKIIKTTKNYTKQQIKVGLACKGPFLQLAGEFHKASKTTTKVNMKPIPSLINTL